MKKLALTLLILLCAAHVYAQDPVKNPTGVVWTCPDHDIDNQHSLVMLRIEGTNRVIITTILLGDPNYSNATTKEVSAGINVQPIAHGTYVSRMSVSATDAQGVVYTSELSAESNIWQRVPGAPGGLRIIAELLQQGLPVFGG